MTRRDIHEYTADAMLAFLAEAQERYVTAKYDADQADAMMKRVFALTFLEIKKREGCSIEEAKQRALSMESYVECCDKHAELELEKARRMNALERARTAIELWRSEAANRRQV